MSLLVVAAWLEDTDWVNDLPDGWVPWVIRKDIDLSNVGREASTFAHALATAPAHDRYGFVQGNPFDHCADLFDRLGVYTDGFAWLGDPNHTSDSQGQPHDDCPVGEFHRRFAGGPCPDVVRFAPGGQFCIDHRLRVSRTPETWRALQTAATVGKAPWALERLWEAIFHATHTQGL